MASGCSMLDVTRGCSQHAWATRRWQEDETLVCPGLRLNMSRWQLEALHRGVADAGCLYVWIDRIALPQYSSGLQVALLARSGEAATADPKLPADLLHIFYMRVAHIVLADVDMLLLQ